MNWIIKYLIVYPFYFISLIFIYIIFYIHEEIIIMNNKKTKMFSFCKEIYENIIKEIEDIIYFINFGKYEKENFN